MDGIRIENESIVSLYVDIRSSSENPSRQIFSREFVSDTNRNLHSLSQNFRADHVMIIGVGGIGAWAALFFSRMKTVRSLILVDPDCIEITNLNRTPFGLPDIGDLKVRAISQMISSNNVALNVFSYNMLFNEEFIEMAISTKPDWLRDRYYSDVLLVVDCRDNYFNDYDLLNKLSVGEYNIIRSAYNGGSVTIDFDPRSHPVSGSGGYETQPSHVLPAALAGLLAVVCSLNYNNYRYSNKNKTKEKNGSYLYHTPLTFDATRAIEYLFNGLMLHRLACSGDVSAQDVMSKLIDNSYFLSANEDAVFDNESNKSL